MNGLGSGILEIVMALIGVAVIALLVGNASKTSQLVSTAGSTLNDLLKTVTLSNSMSLTSYSF